MKLKQQLLIILTLTAAVCLFSCSDSSSPSDDGNVWKDNSVTFDVQWSENTVTLDSSDFQAIVDIDEENRIYTFKAGSAFAQSLSEGKIFVLQGTAMRKVSSISEDGDNIVVETEDAYLYEAIKKGKIAWDYGIEFNPGTITEIKMKEGKNVVLTPTGGDGDSIGASFSYNGYDYSLYILLKGSQAYCYFEISKEISKGVGVKLTLKGTIDRFRSKNEINIDDNKITGMNVSNTNLKGDFEISMVANASLNQEITYEPDLTLLSFPVPGMYIPATIDLKVLFTFMFQIPLSGSTNVTARFKYDSETGFTFNGTEASAGGQMGDIEVSKGEIATGAPSFIGARFGVAFPRLALSVADDLLVPWIHTAYQISGTYTMGTKPCQESIGHYIGACGLDINVFDIWKYNKVINLWDKQIVLLRAGDCD